MSYYEIIDAFTYYGADVVALSIATSALTQLLKVTLLKNTDKKFITFVPFIVGTLLYAVYFTIANLSFIKLFESISLVFERGAAVGTLATLIYVIYEQFGRGGGSGGSTVCKLIISLIKAYVRSDCLKDAACELQDKLSESCSTEEIVKVLDTYSEESVTSDEKENLACLLAAAFKSLKS